MNKNVHRRTPAGACRTVGLVFGVAGLILALMGSLLGIIPLLLSNLFWRLV